MIVTILLATAILLICTACLAIGFLITGKSKLKKGCGTRPNAKCDNCDHCDRG